MKVIFWAIVALIVFATWHIWSDATTTMSDGAAVGKFFAWAAVVVPLCIVALVFKPRG